MSPLTPWSVSGLRAQACTCQPLAAYCLVKSRPRPRAAPVISTVGMNAPLAPCQQARPLALPVAVLDRLPLVVRLLAGRESDLDFRPAALVEIDLQRHDGAALALDGADQHVDLALVQQQLARPLALVIEAVAGGVFGDVGIDQPGLAAILRDVGFGDRAAAAAQGFHLGAGQRDAGLHGLLDEVVVPRLAVLGHYRAVQL